MSCHYVTNWSSTHPRFNEVVRMDQNEIRHPWSLSEWQTGMNEQTVFLWETNQLRGFALYRISKLEGLAHLLKITLIKEARQTGESSQFWQGHIPTLRSLGCERVYLEVASDNRVAIKFYQRLGFRMLHEVKGFYSDGQSALTMELVI